MIILLRIAKYGLRFLYLFLRPIPVRNKVVFFSRQSNEIPLDFRLLAEEIHRQSPGTELRFFCRKMRRKTNLLTYSLFILRSLYHLATAAVAVTDTYSIQLCILGAKLEPDHRADLARPGGGEAVQLPVSGPARRSDQRPGQGHGHASEL